MDPEGLHSLDPVAHNAPLVAPLQNKYIQTSAKQVHVQNMYKSKTYLPLVTLKTRGEIIGIQNF